MDLKIIYLDLPFWRAEVARITLFIADIKFDDFRINSEEFSYLQENGKLKDGIPDERYVALHKSVLSGFLSNIAQKKEKNFFHVLLGKKGGV